MTSPAHTATGSRLISFTRWLAWTALVLIVFLMFVPPALRPLSHLPHALEHLLLFLLTGVAFGLGYREQRLTMALAAVPVTAVLELLQLLAPGRHARMSDFVVDAIGACAGIMIAAVTCRNRSR
jgi:VanZ family protein